MNITASMMTLLHDIVVGFLLKVMAQELPVFE
jgi:hypothetical protein